jgi:ribonuclease HI
MYIGYFDGSCEPRNPGGAMGWGAHVVLEGETVWKGSRSAPAAKANSNNVAEYRALILLLDYFTEQNLRTHIIEIRGDSKLVINQCFGHWRIKHGLYAPYAREAKEKLKGFLRCSGVWVPREYNSVADSLSRGVIQ